MEQQGGKLNIGNILDLEDYLNKNFYDSGWMDLNNAVKYRKKNGFVTIRADGYTMNWLSRK